MKVETFFFTKCLYIFICIYFKTKRRNILKTETLEALLRGKNLLKRTPCYEFHCSDDLLPYTTIPFTTDN